MTEIKAKIINQTIHVHVPIASQGAVAGSLAQLDDVELASLVDANILQYNALLAKWQNVAIEDLGYSPVGHSHVIGDVTGLQAALDAKSAVGHTHDDRYYTETEIDTFLSGKSNTGHTHTASNITDFSTAADARITAQKGAANGLATLGADSKIPIAQLPALTLTDTFVVGSQAAMLALSAETGDVAVRSDLNKSYILAGDDPTVLGDWQELLTPTDSVLSVNSQTGAVVLTTSHITEGSNLYYTDARVQTVGDARYLKLDASNDPLTGTLTITPASGAGLVVNQASGQNGILINASATPDHIFVIKDPSLVNRFRIDSNYELYFTNSAGSDSVWINDDGNAYFKKYMRVGAFAAPTNTTDGDLTAIRLFLGTNQNQFRVENNGSLITVLGTVTADSPTLNSTVTWNNAGVTFNQLYLNVTNTASHAASKVVNLQVNSSPILTLDPIGNLLNAGYLRVGSLTAPANTTAGDLTFIRGFATSISLSGAITLGTDLAITEGGTGASTATDARTNLGLGNSAVLDVGTTAGTVAAGDHAHTGVYEPANANIQAHIAGTGTSVHGDSYLLNTGDTGSGDYALSGYLRVGSVSAPTNTTAGDITGVRLFLGSGQSVNLYEASTDALKTDDSFFVAGASTRLTNYLRVGSLSAPNNTTAGDLTSTRLSVGNGTLSSAVGGTSVAIFTGSPVIGDSNAGSTNAGITATITWDSSVDSANQYRTMNMSMTTASSSTVNFTSTTGLVAGWFETRHQGQGSITVLRAGSFQNFINGANFTAANSSVVSNAYGILVTAVTNSANTPTGTITNAIGIQVANNALGSGPLVITNEFGLDISSLSRASTNSIGVRIAAPGGSATNKYALQLSDATGVAAGGITFGTDVQLYRSAANVLKLDDNFAFDGESARDITVARSTIGAGASLTIQTGSALSGSTNTAAGNLIFSTGIGTGNTGGQGIGFKISVPGSSGTTDQTVTTRLFMLGSANTRIILGNQVETATDTNDGLNFIGTIAQNIYHKRHTTSNTAGNNLTIQAGGATSGATDKAGGHLLLTTGISTGTGLSQIQLWAHKQGSTGTTDNTAVNIMNFHFVAGTPGTIQMAPAVAASGAGADLQIFSQQAAAGTDLNGGSFYLKANTSRGTGTASIFLQTPTPAGISGSGANTPVTRVSIDSTGVQIPAASTSALRLTDTGGTATGGITFGADVQLYRSAANVLKLDDNFAFDGEAVRDITVARNTTTIGQTLTIQAGGALSGGTNLGGGTLIISSGISTGTGRSDIEFRTAVTGGSGTGDNTPGASFAILGTSPRGTISIGGVSAIYTGMNIRATSAYQIGMVRHSTANTAGNNLTVNAGGAASAATDKAGGSLILTSGISTGTANSLVKVQTYTAASASGTTDNTAIDRLIITSPKALTDAVATNLISCTIASGSVIGGIIRYSIEVTDGTDFQIETGYVVFSATNKAGVVTCTITEHNSQQNTTAGTLTSAWAMSAASPAVISVNADTSLTPSAGYPRITYVVENFTQQAIAIQ